jgi:hypothetical protein
VHGDLGARRVGKERHECRLQTCSAVDVICAYLAVNLVWGLGFGAWGLGLGAWGLGLGV